MHFGPMFWACNGHTRCPLQAKNVHNMTSTICERSIWAPQETSWTSKRAVGEKKTNTFVLHAITTMCKYHTKMETIVIWNHFQPLVIQSCSRLGSSELQP